MSASDMPSMSALLPIPMAASRSFGFMPSIKAPSSPPASSGPRASINRMYCCASGLELSSRASSKRVRSLLPLSSHSRGASLFMYFSGSLIKDATGMTLARPLTSSVSYSYASSAARHSEAMLHSVTHSLTSCTVNACGALSSSASSSSSSSSSLETSPSLFGDFKRREHSERHMSPHSEGTMSSTAFVNSCAHSYSHVRKHCALSLVSSTQVGLVAHSPLSSEHLSTPPASRKRFRQAWAFVTPATSTASTAAHWLRHFSPH
mmetsp:Transcript_29972/g.60134  ORF Transcript_29972/g.60134 Transcript_29972/m.60134 type:complete len:263 (-) Transcript_29972:133-921(-)